jgi:hypothetical protein
MNNKNVAIIISSFDGYEDLWKPLEETYKMYWSDCPYKIYITTNFKKPSFEIFNYIAIGKDYSWSDTLYKSIESLDEKYILLTFDDLFLKTKIDTKNITGFVDYVIDNNIDYFQFYSSISEYTKITDKIVSKNKNSRYRNATVWSLWKKEVLLDLLDRGENAWEFEDKGSIRSNKYDKFYCVNYPAIPYVNGVIKGKWVPSAVKELQKKGIKLDLSKRKLMTFKENLRYQFVNKAYNTYKSLIFKGNL